jgi:hypothetical protein
MGAGYRHTCDKWGYSVSTTGPYEFYRDRFGQRKVYGHPHAISEEARERGIAGFAAKMFCTSCDEVVDVILQDFPTTLDRPLDAWLGASNTRLQGAQARCPDCGSPELLLGGRDDAIVACPRCQRGNLVGKLEWIS